MCVLVVHLDSQAKVSHLGDTAPLTAAVTLQQHVAHLEVAVNHLQGQHKTIMNIAFTSWAHVTLATLEPNLLP
jgi:hypothetical protein